MLTLTGSFEKKGFFSTARRVKAGQYLRNMPIVVPISLKIKKKSTLTLTKQIKNAKI